MSGATDERLWPLAAGLVRPSLTDEISTRERWEERQEFILTYHTHKQSDRIHRNHPKHSNPENCCFRYTRPQKSPKIAQKLNRDLLNFLNKEWCIKGGTW